MSWQESLLESVAEPKIFTSPLLKDFSPCQVKGFFRTSKIQSEKCDAVLCLAEIVRPKVLESPGKVLENYVEPPNYCKAVKLLGIHAIEEQFIIIIIIKCACPYFVQLCHRTFYGIGTIINTYY